MRKSIVYPKGSFFKLEYGATLTVQDFVFSGTANFDFIQFSKPAFVEIKNVKIILKEDVYGIFFNDVQKSYSNENSLNLIVMENITIQGEANLTIYSTIFKFQSNY